MDAIPTTEATLGGNGIFGDEQLSYQVLVKVKDLTECQKLAVDK